VPVVLRDVSGEQVEEALAEVRAEIDRLAALASGAPIAGFYTYGEIARTRGLRGFHNETLVVLSVA
jgi:hypothetical protein